MPPLHRRLREERVRGHTALLCGQGQDGDRAAHTHGWSQRELSHKLTRLGDLQVSSGTMNTPSLVLPHRAAPRPHSEVSASAPSPVSGPYLRDPSPHPPPHPFTGHLHHAGLPSLHLPTSAGTPSPLPSDCRLLLPPLESSLSLRAPTHYRDSLALLPLPLWVPPRPTPLSLQIPTSTPQGSGLSTYRTSPPPTPYRDSFQPPLDP